LRKEVLHIDNLKDSRNLNNKLMLLLRLASKQIEKEIDFSQQPSQFFKFNKLKTFGFLTEYCILNLYILNYSKRIIPKE